MCNLIDNRLFSKIIVCTVVYALGEGRREILSQRLNDSAANNMDKDYVESG